MCNERQCLPCSIQESYKRLVAEKNNGGITDQSISELLEVLAHKPGAVDVLKKYVYGGMQHEANVK